MDQFTIADIENLIKHFYNSSDATTTKQIQEQLQIIQKQPYSWDVASQLLASESDHCRFFGAHTFQIKISRDWDTLPEDKIEWLKEELLGWITRLCTGPAFITTKLYIALITFAFYTVPAHWSNFIPDTIESLQRGSQLYQIPADVLNMAILEFCTLVPEEVSHANLLGGRKLQLIGELKASIPLILSSISTFIFSENLAVRLKVLKCLQSWIQYGISLEETYPLLQRTMIMLGDEEVFEASVDVLSECMQQNAWTKYHTLRNDLLLCFTSEEMKIKFDTCIADDDEETARSLAKLFTNFGETYTDYITKELVNPNVRVLLNMIMRLTGFEGYFPVDQEVSEIPLNFWYILQETLYDESVLPINTNDEWIKNCGQTAMTIYRELVLVLIKNARYPDDDIWAMWNKDMQDRFKIWRRDLGDTMINPYYVLRNDMLSILLEYASTILNQWSSLPSASQELEAALFCLKSISEEIPHEESEHVAKFFGQEVLGRLPADCHVRLKNTVLALLGSLSEWLKLHPQYLGAVMNYIVPCLSDTRLAQSASTSFAEICDHCRESLVNELDSLMQVYVTMANSHIKPSILQKVVESVADVIQVLPPERAIAPLMSLTSDILQGIAAALHSNDAQVREKILYQIQCLSACCRGIQSPNDDYQSLNERMSIYDAFASGQLAAAYAKIGGFNEMMYAIHASSTEIARVWCADEEISKALSHFLDLGMKSTSPLLSLKFEDLALLVESAYNTAPFSCWLDTASLMMNVYGGQSMHYERLRNLLAALTRKTFELIYGAEAMEHYPDIVDSYFDLLSRTIRRCPIAFYELPTDIINTIFMFVIAGMGLQERLALKAALNFVAEFVSQELQEGSNISKAVDIIMMNKGMQIMEQLLLGIGGRVPRSFSGPLVDALYKIIGRYLEASKQWLQTLLSNDNFPSAMASQNDKETFLKGVLGTRSFKRFKENVNTFSIKCRGLANTSF
ncbi:hypothetical protein G6F55_008680 [Rhizopus delemar]|uniref:Importin-13 n=2 Tax=Rhizopus TaxID=4842 RepID=A0A9P7CLG9_9FUNG|nr:hypothetical protein G6F55_008680 [Rhizopus delemar]KAG1538911.1 hypothetical protein G6F51_009471 [Rhizopus arrhizus]KAG1493173.1 hypothetical protein G6F54_008774 [Rhizopus delemar]KAG1506677.1 hypothetical protein G6F53_009517 [Rhizopus delemar]KAG1521919.1 hypothetical protein G6F52_006311 [Rhizopus delemar]